MQNEERVFGTPWSSICTSKNAPAAEDCGLRVREAKTDFQLIDVNSVCRDVGSQSAGKAVVA